VESAAPLSTTPITGDVFVPTQLPNGSDLPGGILLLNRANYGIDPSYGVNEDDIRVNWVTIASNLGVKAIILEEYEENLLYRRWDPYTLLGIPVVQVRLPVR
jgi:hypothetical protein